MPAVLRRCLPLLAALALVAAACGSDSDLNDVAAGDDAADESPTGEAAADATEDAELELPDSSDKPEVELPDEAPDDLVVEDLVVGDGTEAVVGSEVTVHYVGVSLSNGEQFDASWDRGQPLVFSLGAGQVIQGWDRGVEGMRVGGRRQLVIPPELGYGATGQGAIAPNETLVFVVDLLDVSLPEFPVTTEADEPELTLPEVAPEGLEIEDLVPGEGDAAAEGDTVVIHFVGHAMTSGEVISSWRQGQPVEFTLGEGMAIPEIEEGILGMQPGGRRQLAFPEPDAVQDGSEVPWYVFVVDLVTIR